MKLAEKLGVSSLVMFVLVVAWCVVDMYFIHPLPVCNQVEEFEVERIWLEGRFSDQHWVSAVVDGEERIVYTTTREDWAGLFVGDVVTMTRMTSGVCDE